MQLERAGKGYVVSPRLWVKGAPVVVRPFGQDMAGKVEGAVFDERTQSLKVAVQTERGLKLFRDRKVRFDGNLK